MSLIRQQTGFYVLLCGILCLLCGTSQAQSEPDSSQVAVLGRGTAETLAWHPSGELLAVAGSRGIWLYDDTMADVAHIPQADDITHRLTWSPDGRYLAGTNDSSTMLTVWQFAENPYALSLHQTFTFEDIQHQAWSPDGEHLAVLTDEGAQIIAINSGTVQQTMPQMVRRLAWHPDGERIAGLITTAQITRQVHIWDATTGEVIQAYNTPKERPLWWGLQWNNAGTRLAGTTSHPSFLHIWDAATGKLLHNIQIDTSAPISFTYGMQWTADDSQLALVQVPGMRQSIQSDLLVYDVAAGADELHAAAIDIMQDVDGHARSRRWALLTEDDRVLIRAFAGDSTLHSRSPYKDPAQQLVWSPDSTRLLVQQDAFRRPLYLLHVADPSQPTSQTLPGYNGLSFEDISWSADGQMVRATWRNLPPQATTIIHELVRWHIGGIIHSADNPQILYSYQGNWNPLFTWNSDVTRVALVNADYNQIRIQSVTRRDNGTVRTGETLHTIPLENRARDIVWNPSETRLAVTIETGSNNQQTAVFIYDIAGKERIQQMQPPAGYSVYDVAWSADGSQVALASRYTTETSDDPRYRLDVFPVNDSDNDTLITQQQIGRRIHTAWHPQTNLLAVTRFDQVDIIAPGSRDSVATIPEMPARSLAWSPDGRWLAAGHEDGTVRLLDVSRFNE